MHRLISSALLVGCLAFATGCPTTGDPDIEAGTFAVRVTLSSQFGGAVDCGMIELVSTSSAGVVFRDRGACPASPTTATTLTWDSDLLPLELYRTQVNMYDVNGQVGAQTAVLEQSIDLDGEVVELNFDLVQDAGNYSLSWVFTGELSGSALTCADAGATDVFLRPTLQADASAWDDQFDCTLGAGAGQYVPIGTYTVTVTLEDGVTELDATTPTEMTIDFGGHVNDLGEIEFIVPGL